MTDRPDRNNFRERCFLGPQFPSHGGGGVAEWLCLWQEEHKVEAVYGVIDPGNRKLLEPAAELWPSKAYP